jgi:hypothetical protein
VTLKVLLRQRVLTLSDAAKFQSCTLLTIRRLMLPNASLLVTAAATAGDLHNTVRAKDRSASSAVLQSVPALPQSGSQQQVCCRSTQGCNTL